MTEDIAFTAVYDELRRIAAAYLARKLPQSSLQPTALVHEAWLRLRERSWTSRQHFFALAARAMRLVLVDTIRARSAQKRPSAGARLEWPSQLEIAGPEVSCPVETLLDLNRAVEELAAKVPRKAQVVEMRFFAGMDFPEIAEVLDVSLITAKRDWEFARAWLYARLARDGFKVPGTS